MEVTLFFASYPNGDVKTETMEWAKPVSMFKTGEFIHTLLRQRNVGDAVTGVMIQSRAPNIVCVANPIHRDTLSGAVGDAVVAILPPPPVLNDRYYSMDYVTFPGRGNVTNRAGLIIRHGRGFDASHRLSEADTTIAYPPVAWLTDGRFEVDSARFCSKTDKNAAIYCYKKRRLFIEPLPNVFLKATFI